MIVDIIMAIVGIYAYLLIGSLFTHIIASSVVGSSSSPADRVILTVTWGFLVPVGALFFAVYYIVIFHNRIFAAIFRSASRMEIPAWASELRNRWLKK